MMLPRQAQLLPTERCNLACAHCAVPEEDSPVEHELSTDAWRSNIDNLMAHGVSQVWFTGGEPTLRRDLDELVRHALRRGAERVVVVTNGTTLSEARARLWGEFCRSYPRFALHLSVDGTDRASHDRIRGQGAWDRTMDGVSNLRRHGGWVSVIQSTLTSSNIVGVSDLPKLVDAIGARGLHLFSLAQVGRASSMGREFIAGEDWDRALAVLAALGALGLKVSAQGPIVGDDWEPSAERAPRPAASRTPTVVVGPDGALFPCPFLRHVEIGNAGDTNSLGQTIRGFDDVTSTACGSCRYLPMCAGLDLQSPFWSTTTTTTHPHDHFPVPQVPVKVQLR